MLEIERKFLVKLEVWEILNKIKPKELVQGYLTKNEKGSVRVRIETTPGDGNSFYTEAYLMSKTKIDDMSNNETVDQITVENAERIINNFCEKVIKKKRYLVFNVEADGTRRMWEVDVFTTSNLVLAEIELKSADELIEIPEWIDREVTGESQYYNANM